MIPPPRFIVHENVRTRTLSVFDHLRGYPIRTGLTHATAVDRGRAPGQHALNLGKRLWSLRLQAERAVAGKEIGGGNVMTEGYGCDHAWVVDHVDRV